MARDSPNIHEYWVPQSSSTVECWVSAPLRSIAHHLIFGPKSCIGSSLYVANANPTVCAQTLFSQSAPLRSWMKTQSRESGVLRGCHGNRGKLRASWPRRAEESLVWPAGPVHVHVHVVDVWYRNLLEIPTESVGTTDTSELYFVGAVLVRTAAPTYRAGNIVFAKLPFGSCWDHSCSALLRGPTNIGVRRKP